VNLKRAHVIIINKTDTAGPTDIKTIRDNVKIHNREATIIEAASPIQAADPDQIRDRRVLVIEDGPTVTHGGMLYGAGKIAAKQYGAREIIGPGPWAKGTLRETLDRYPHLKNILPAMGYGKEQIKDLGGYGPCGRRRSGGCRDAH